MNITKTNLPKKSLLAISGIKHDYVDSFEGKIQDSENILNITVLGKSFFSYSPKWVSSLFILRNKLVGIFGLKTSDKITNRQQRLDAFNCEVGQSLGLFKVFEKTENEVILGEDDKHLNFRVSLFLENSSILNQKNIIISTTVKSNNWFGKLYFLLVRPFHKLIVPTMLKSIIKNLEIKNKLHKIDY